MRKKRRAPDMMSALGTDIRYERRPGDKFLTITAKRKLDQVLLWKRDKKGSAKPTWIKPKKGYVTWKVPEVSAHCASQLKLLGVADGDNFYHCLYLIRKYSEKNFLKDFCGYKISSSKKSGFAMSVSFYKLPERK